MSNAETIALVIQDAQLREGFLAMLGPTYVVISSSPDQITDCNWSLCIIDCLSYKETERFRSEYCLQANSPILLVLSDQDLEANRARIENDVADVLRLPLRKSELQLRVKRLLNVQRQSVELRQLRAAIRKEVQPPLELAVEAANIGIWDWHLVSGTIYVSPEWKKLIGYKPQKKMNSVEEWQELIHPDDRERVNAARKSFMSSPQNTVMTEYRLHHKDGSYRWVLGSTSALLDSENKIQRILGATIDISDRKQAEKDLDRERTQLSVTLQSIADGVMATDTNGNITMMNPAAERLTGWNKNDALGKPAGSVFRLLDKNQLENPDPVETALQTLRNVYLPKGAALQTKKNATIPITDSCAPIIEADGAIRGVVIVFRDNTRDRDYERSLKNSISQKEILIQELYHRTRNNMSVIFSLLELQAEKTEDEKVRQVIRESQDRIQSMALAHENLYSSQNLSSISMKQYLNSLINLLAERYEMSFEEITIYRRIEDIGLMIDLAVPCGLIATELLTNSLKHAFPPGRKGVIDIGLHECIACEIELTVEDDGIGVEDNLDFKTNPTLGIQLVYQIAESQLNGSVEIERKRKGIRWRIRFRSDLYPERV